MLGDIFRADAGVAIRCSQIELDGGCLDPWVILFCEGKPSAGG